MLCGDLSLYRWSLNMESVTRGLAVLSGEIQARSGASIRDQDV